MPLPTPEGPETTMGRLSGGTGSTEEALLAERTTEGRQTIQWDRGVWEDVRSAMAEKGRRKRNWGRGRVRREGGSAARVTRVVIKVMRRKMSEQVAKGVWSEVEAFPRGSGAGRCGGVGWPSLQASAVQSQQKLQATTHQARQDGTLPGRRAGA